MESRLELLTGGLNEVDEHEERDELSPSLPFQISSHLF